MHHFFVDPGQIGKDNVQITGQDAQHIGLALRMKPGEEICVRTGQDSLVYRCRILQVTPDLVEAQIMWKEDQDAELPSDIRLFQCLPKSDKMEWIIQKAVELGAKEIIPVESRRSIVRLSGSKAENKVRRWNAVSESAAKQSGRALVPQVHSVLSFGEAIRYASGLDVLLFPYEMAEGMDHTRNVLKEIVPGRSIGIFIGPEGGFDPSEVDLAKQNGAKIITLGKRILRTETAGMALIASLMLQLETDS